MSQNDLPTTANPANAPEKRTASRGRVPMSLPVQKLAVPEIPGMHCHWMRGDAQRIAQALKAGYAFVEQDEVDLNTVGLGNGEEDSGHQDLGSRVSFVSGTDEQGRAQRLFLMKLPLELWEQDQAVLANQQEGIAAQLRGDRGFSQAGSDSSNRYSNKEQSNLFKPISQRRP